MNPADDRGGYSLTSVTWGYRDIFSKTIQRLFDEGYLGPEREEITRQFFSLLRCSEAGLYDHVLKEFLDSLVGDSAWIFDLPAIFGEIIRTGSRFAEAKMFYGIEFYRILKDGGFGDSPEKVQFLLTWLKKLGEIDMELSFAFLKGYQTMLERLELSEIQHFADEGARLFTGSTQTGLRFMQCRLESSENYFQELTRECRLEDIDSSLERLLLALTGMHILPVPLSGLDPDQLLARSSAMVCLPRWVALPDRIRRYASKGRNHRRYILNAVCAAAYYACKSLPVIHGLEAYRSLADVAGHDMGKRNLTAIIEHTRALAYVAEHWPGAISILRTAMAEELLGTMDGDGPGEVLAGLADWALNGMPQKPDVVRKSIWELSRQSRSILATGRIVSESAGRLLPEVHRQFPAFNSRELPPVSFLPDLFYRISAGAEAPANGGVTDSAAALSSIKERAAEMLADLDGRKVQTSLTEDAEASASDDESPRETEAVDSGPRIPFLYDEWSNEENTYYRGHCSLYEERPAETEENVTPETALEQIEKIRRIFEMLKPVIVNKIKRLSEGDEVNHDLLVQYVVDSKLDPSPKINFYERPLINRRDLSVLVLLDVSGSTDEEVEGGKILDTEKQAALILGQGLASLGDAFSICGFSSNGRENCRFYIYKDFKDEWGNRPIANLYSATSSSSTRIGVALRHAGGLLEQQPSRQRLIVLITDGRPMDQGYDPETRYAQHDVRMACEENRKNGVLTFCVSTMENSRADMEIMFPERRFVILKSIAQLPKVLPQLYIRLTT